MLVGCGSADRGSAAGGSGGDTVARCVSLWNTAASADQKGELVTDGQMHQAGTAFVTAYDGASWPGQIMGEDPGSFTFSAGDCLVVPGGLDTVWAHDGSGWQSVGVDTSGTETTTPWQLVLERADSAPNAEIAADGSLTAQ